MRSTEAEQGANYFVFHVRVSDVNLWWDRPGNDLRLDSEPDWKVT